MSNKVSYIIIVVVFVLVGGLITYGIISSKNVPTPQPVSQLVLSPSPVLSPTIEAEPVVTAWKPYSNTQYNFTVEVPEGWKEQDYSRHYPQGGTVIAFSPDSLPCGTCTYVSEGYISIAVFSQKTQPERYAAFLEMIKKIGKEPNYRQVALDGKPGVYSGKSIAIENQGWVYEISLDRGSTPALESYIFQRFATSFTFTYLLFNN